MTTAQAPNHHGDHPGLAGFSGLVAALTMTFGRGDDARLVASLTETGAGDVVVDIGCGPGAAVRHASRLGATAIGVDPAAVMRRVARILGVGVRNVRLLDGTAEALPVPDGSATVAWSVATVHHWTDLEAGLREVRRVLEPGGQFLAMERRTHEGAQGLASHGWTDEQADAFAERCTANGFHDVRVERGSTRRGTMLIVQAVAPTA